MKLLTKKIKNDKAITLIALVITIVVLIILAVVTINLTIGNNGIFQRAKTAKEEYQNAQASEYDTINDAYGKIQVASDGTVTMNLDDLKTLIRKEGNLTGTIIAFYGDTAPDGYLPCDGTERNVSQYSALATFLGATGETFNLPDLRGEFLRGAGTNSHTNQGNGETVGTHQNATQHLYTKGFGGEHALAIAMVDSTPNVDSSITGNNYLRKASVSTADLTGANYYTSRPTNTSVLYCIKY